MQEKRKKKKNSITLTKHFTKFSAILDNTLTNLTNFTKKNASEKYFHSWCFSKFQK